MPAAERGQSGRRGAITAVDDHRIEGLFGQQDPSTEKAHHAILLTNEQCLGQVEHLQTSHRRSQRVGARWITHEYQARG